MGPLPDCIPIEERDIGMNVDLLEAGVPLCPEEELPGYEYPVPENPLTLPPKVPEPVPSTTSSPEPSQSPTLAVFDDYDADDVPVDQAPPAPECIEAAIKDDGYNPTFLEQGVPLCPEELPGYPVPENPLTLPPRIPASPTTTSSPEPSQSPTLEVLYVDDYDPEDVPIDQAPPAPDCIVAAEKDEGYNPTFLEQGVPLCPEEELPGYEYPVPENPLYHQKFQPHQSQLPFQNLQQPLFLLHLSAFQPLNKMMDTI